MTVGIRLRKLEQAVARARKLLFPFALRHTSSRLTTAFSCSQAEGRLAWRTFSCRNTEPLLPMRSNQLSFFDVLAFAAGYWRQQRCRLAVILSMFVSAALLETYLPTALSNFLATIRLGQGKTAILGALAVFLGVYLVQMVLFGVAFIFYNVFETTIFKSLLDDAYAHVQRLSEHFFVNTFTGAIVSKISRARQKIESFEDQILIRNVPTIVVLAGSTAFLALRFPVLAMLMIGYVGLLFLVSAFFVFKISGPAQGVY